VFWAPPKVSSVQQVWVTERRCVRRLTARQKLYRLLQKRVRSFNICQLILGHILSFRCHYIPSNSTGRPWPTKSYIIITTERSSRRVMQSIRGVCMCVCVCSQKEMPFDLDNLARWFTLTLSKSSLWVKVIGQGHGWKNTKEEKNFRLRMRADLLRDTCQTAVEPPAWGRAFSRVCLSVCLSAL